MRLKVLVAVLLIGASVVLGATVLRDPIANAASPFTNVIVGNTADNPVPVQGTVKSGDLTRVLFDDTIKPSDNTGLTRVVDVSGARTIRVSAEFSCFNVGAGARLIFSSGTSTTLATVAPGPPLAQVGFSAGVCLGVSPALAFVQQTFDVPGVSLVIHAALICSNCEAAADVAAHVTVFGRP